MATHGLALVVAPVGYGKTTFLGQWSAARPGRVLWRSPPALADSEASLRAGARAGAFSALVIDDVGVGAAKRPRERLVRLIEELSEVVPVVVATVRLPDVNLARHEFPNPVVVTARDLAFCSWEVTGLFADVYGDTLGAEDSLAIAERTGGWAAALRLWHLARRLQEHSGQLETGSDPSAFESLLRGYLEREVLSLLGPGSRRALAMSAAFDTVTAPPSRPPPRSGGQPPSAVADRSQGQPRRCLLVRL